MTGIMMKMTAVNNDYLIKLRITRNKQEKVTDRFLLFILFIIRCRVIALCCRACRVALGLAVMLACHPSKINAYKLSLRPFKGYTHEGGLSETSWVKCDFYIKDPKHFIWIAHGLCRRSKIQTIIGDKLQVVIIFARTRPVLHMPFSEKNNINLEYIIIWKNSIAAAKVANQLSFQAGEPGSVFDK